MVKLNQKGSLLIPVIVLGTLLLVSLVFGLWAFAGRQDYKNNVQSKIDEAVKEAETQLALEKDAEFAEREKSPNRTYQGPSAFGSLSITYPKPWSVYVDERGSGSTPLKGYMQPNYVQVDEQEVIYALRFEIVETDYQQVLKGFDGARRTGKVTVEAYRAPKVPNELGSRLSGEVVPRKQGDMVLLPLRDKTIKIWTEGNDFRSDFNNILAALSFVP